MFGLTIILLYDIVIKENIINLLFDFYIQGG